jgi:hypothetical protein
VNKSNQPDNNPPQFLCGMNLAYVSDILTRYATLLR